MAKKSAVELKRYFALDTLANASGSQRWLPGSIIELEDERALPLLEAGKIAAHPDNATPPHAAASTVDVIAQGQSAALLDTPVEG